jgi:putative hydroxymethylpyrimidine transport system permease protein
MAPTESHRLQRAAGRALPPFVLLVGAVAVWEVVVRLDHVPSYLVPSPAAVASSLHGDAHLLGGATLVTVREMIAGYLLAVAGALAIAVFLHFSSALRKALLPLLVLSQAVPTVLLAPILAILLGYGIEPKLAVVAVVCFFPIVVNAVDGFRAADPQLLLLMRALHAGRISTFRRLEFPAALPAIFSGARVAATYAAVGAVFGEWAGSSAGLGFVILQAQPALDTARILAAVLILSAVALGLYALVTLAQRLLIPWYTEASRE